MTYQPRPRLYDVRYHDGKKAHQAQVEALARKDVYAMYKQYKVLSVVFVRWVEDK
jgi:hypothetical protein